jgi:cytochrome c
MEKNPMRTIVTALAIACSLVTATAHAAPPASFAACAACHTSDGTSGLGPSAKGLYGRKAGTAKGFTYSAAMKRAGVTWDDGTLDAFITDPQKAVPGNVMPFPGVADAKQRAEIIDYLKSVK